MKDVLDALKKAIEEGQAKDAARAVVAAIDAGAEPRGDPAGGDGARHGRGGPALRVRRLLPARDAHLRPRHEGGPRAPAAAPGGDRRQAGGHGGLGTVKGDLHDIGKNLVCMMLEGAGFEVRDLGVDVAPEKFVDAAGAAG